MSSAEEILSKHQRMAKAALKINEIKDPKEILEQAEKLREMGKELEAACKRFEEATGVKGGPEERVVLTDDQRKRLAESTGVPMDMLVVRDPTGQFRSAMPTTDRATIERMAAVQAAEIAVRKAKAKAVEDLIKSLEKMDLPELQPIIDAIKADPTLKLLEKQQMEAAEAVKAQAAANEALLQQNQGG